MSTEQKSIRAEIKQADDSGAFEAVIATLGVIDHDGDIIEAGAFDGATISIVPAHDHSSIPLGKAKMEDRGNVAVAVGQFNLDVMAAKEWVSALKFDLKNPPAVQEWSFAFRVLDSEEETRDGQPVRILKKMDVMEVSPVLRGAGKGTGTLRVKGTFEQQLAKTLTALTDVLVRAKEIAALRAAKEKPKALSDERKAQIEKVREAWKDLDGVIAPVKTEDDETLEHSPEDEILAEQLAREAAALGVD